MFDNKTESQAREEIYSEKTKTVMMAHTSEVHLI